MVLDTDEFLKLFAAKGAVLMRADITSDNPPAQALLEDLGNPAGAIPFLAVFCGDKPDEPRVLEDFNPLNPGDYRRRLREVLAGCRDAPKMETANLPGSG